MTVTGREPVSTGNLAAVIGEAISGTVLYDNESQDEHQVTLSDDLADFDYIEIYWHYSRESGSDHGDGCERFMGSLANGTCFPYSINGSGPRYVPCTGIINVSGRMLTMTSTDATGEINGNYLKFRRVVGYRSGGGAARS